jgi:beta-mannosidase
MDLLDVKKRSTLRATGAGILMTASGGLIDKKDWEYKTTLVIDKQTFARNNIELVFEGLDNYADVYVNDKLVMKADNMFREWTADIKNAVKEGNNSLRVYFHSPIKVGLKKLGEYGYNLPAVNDQSENGDIGKDKVSVFAARLAINMDGTGGHVL